jgi:hypothetical protein
MSFTLSSLPILNASKCGMPALESFRVFSVTSLIVRLPASAWMSEKESFLLEIKRVDFSLSILRMEPK